MKIALCLCGVVGNLYSDKKHFRWSQDVDYRIGLEHYRRHLFGANSHPSIEIDVFIHSWSTRFEDRLIHAYEPKLAKFESQIDFGQPVRRLNFIKSRWFSTKAVVELKRQHERAQGFVYDWVMTSRFDLALLKDLEFPKYDPSFLWSPHHEWRADTLFVECEPKFCDYWFYSSSANMDRFATLFDHWDGYGFDDPHLDAYVHARKLKLGMRSDFMEHRDHELVRALYQDCHYRGEAFPGIDRLSKLITLPTGRFA